jgi:hypothetical protein
MAWLTQLHQSKDLSRPSVVCPGLARNDIPFFFFDQLMDGGVILDFQSAPLPESRVLHIEKIGARLSMIVRDQLYYGFNHPPACVESAQQKQIIGRVKPGSREIQQFFPHSLDIQIVKGIHNDLLSSIPDALTVSKIGVLSQE